MEVADMIRVLDHSAVTCTMQVMPTIRLASKPFRFPDTIGSRKAANIECGMDYKEYKMRGCNSRSWKNFRDAQYRSAYCGLLLENELAWLDGYDDIFDPSWSNDEQDMRDEYLSLLAEDYPETTPVDDEDRYDRDVFGWTHENLAFYDDTLGWGDEDMYFSDVMPSLIGIEDSIKYGFLDPIE